ncbi:MAG: hypothetical protein ACRDL5_16265, partial [Solirubrobacteraceae bacterium]
PRLLEPAAAALRPAQDPECELLPDAAFAVFDPRAPVTAAAIAAHAQLGPAGPPLQIGVPISAGVPVAEALPLLAQALTLGGVDLDATPQLAILERPLFEAEIAWLRARLPGSASGAAAALVSSEPEGDTGAALVSA